MGRQSDVRPASGRACALAAMDERENNEDFQVPTICTSSDGESPTKPSAEDLPMTTSTFAAPEAPHIFSLQQSDTRCRQSGLYPTPWPLYLLSRRTWATEIRK